MEKLNIITCSHKHYALLADLGSTTFFEAYKNLHKHEDIKQYNDNNYNFDVIKQNLKNSNILYFVAYNNFKEVGYIKLIKNVKVEGIDDVVMELEKIYVLPEFYGTGAGDALMQKAIETTKQNGYDKLYLGVWQENKRAIKFYQKHQFEIFGTRTFQLGSTTCNDFLMVKHV
ncbi:MAG: GNAT family N-acetyltransferase [Bacteroidia bacterium]